MPAVLGFGGYAREIASWILESGSSINAFCHLNKETQAKIKSVEITEFPLEVLPEPDAKYEWLVGMYPSCNLLNYGLEVEEINWAAPFVHSLAHISAPCQVLAGTVVGPFAYLGTNVKISSCCLIGAGAKIHFDTIFGSFVTIGSNAVIGSNCRLGNNTVIGQNCSVFDNVYIEQGSIILANTAVYEDIDTPGVYANSASGSGLVCLYEFDPQSEKSPNSIFEDKNIAALYSKLTGIKF